MSRVACSLFNMFLQYYEYGHCGFSHIQLFTQCKYTIKQQNIYIFTESSQQKQSLLQYEQQLLETTEPSCLQSFALLKKLKQSLHQTLVSLVFINTHLSHLPVLTIHCICTVLKK